VDERLGVLVGGIVGEPLADGDQVGDLSDFRRRLERPLELPGPALDLSGRIPRRAAEVAEPDRLVVDLVDRRQRVDEPGPDPLSGGRIGEALRLGLPKYVPSARSMR